MSIIQNIGQLSDDLIISVLRFVDDIYIREFFLYYRPTRQLVKRYYYNEVHFIVTPFRRQQHFCISGNTHSDIIDFNFYAECEEFLLLNGDITPAKILISTGPDFYSLMKLLKKFEKKFMQTAELEIILDCCAMKPDQLSYILSFKNLTRLELAGFKFGNYKQVLNENFPQLTNLKTLQYLAHDVADWQGYDLPPNLQSLDFSWNDTTSVQTIRLQDSITELYLNYSNIDNATFAEFSFPNNLRILMMTTNKALTAIPVDRLPRTLEKLDLSANKIESFTSAAQSWPPNLQEMNLRYNKINDDTLSQLSNIGWPANLKILQLGENFIKNIYQLNHLPNSVQILDLFSNNIRFCNLTHNIDEFRFPSSLKQVLFKFNGELFKDIDPNEGRLKFPDSLEEIDLSFCAIASLKHLKFPDKVKKINLGINEIESLSEYESEYIKWKNLDSLQELSLNQNKIQYLDYWEFPLSLKHLNLSLNVIDNISPSCPLFNGYNQDSKLLTIDISFNQLKSVDGIQLPPTKLSLNLGFNKLGPQFHISSTLLAIDSLELSNNDIEEITYEKAPEPQPLRYIMLDKNNMGNNASRDKLNKTYDDLEDATGRHIKHRKLFSNKITLY